MPTGVQDYWTANEDNQFEKFGHPGKYWAVHTHLGGEMHFTGSMYGYGGAMMIASGSNFTHTCVVNLSGGGSISLDDFRSAFDAKSEQNIFDISVSYVSSSFIAPNIYFFKRQQ
jgi:hypothetical protein